MPFPLPPPALRPAPDLPPPRPMARPRHRGLTRRRPGTLLLLLALCASLPARALTVFACEPEWAALTRMLLPTATVHIATHAGQDPHRIEVRPALVEQLRSADLAVCTGAGLEAGWLPALQQRAGNARVQDGAPGMFHAADQVTLIDTRAATRGPVAGDLHPRGNPHVQTDPQRLLLVAAALARRLQPLVGQEGAAVAQRLAAFETRWRQRIDDWQRRAAGLRGRRIAVQHDTFGYLWAWLGLVPVVDLEPMPGLAPTPGSMQQLLETLRREPPLAMVVVVPYQDARPARWLASQIGRPAGGGVPVLTLPASPAEPLAPQALETWFEQLMRPLLLVAAAR
jgi:zinc/manganese transport system substrate-binding protein